MADPLPTEHIGPVALAPLGEHPYPLVTRPPDGTSLLDWARSERTRLTRALHRAGAILFRGFEGQDLDLFQQLAGIFTDAPFAYHFELTPRSAVTGMVHTATEFASHFYVNLHNECGAQPDWPMRVLFFAARPAPRGGQTPIADGRRILSQLAPPLLRRLREHGIRYFRRVAPADQEKVLGAPDRPSMEAYCRSQGYDFEWQEDGALHLTWHRPIIHNHPETGQEVLFSLLLSYLRPSYQLIARPGPHLGLVPEVPPSKGVSMYAWFGDGSPIPGHAVRHLHNVMVTESVVFPWEQGDILLLDNMLMAHGRYPHTGERSTLVVLGDSYRQLLAGKGARPPEP